MRKDTAIPNTNLRVVAIPVGVQGECGRIVVGCSRTDFPNKLERLLLSVAANQAVTAFQLQWAKAKLAEAYNELRTSQEKELEAAAFIQQGLMAAKLPQPDSAAVTGRNLSCKEIGGDFFTVARMDEGLAVVIADVSGKGTSAAILASLLQGMIQADLQAGLPLSEIAQSANKFLCARELNFKYATLVIALVQANGELEYLNCGHIPPLVTNERGGLVRLREHNVPVGLLSNVEFTSAGFRLRPGDRLILVTDGITEAEYSNGEFFGDQRLEEFAQGEKPLDEIFSAVRLFCAGRPIQDDCTILELAYVCKGAFAPQSASA
jgi:serine phosphatase RsbU (regulator of sigma subunit)